MNKNVIGNILICLIIIFLFWNLAFPVKAETIIYDNITSSNYKYITLEEFNLFLMMDDYKYDIILNGYSIGYYGKNDKIFIPDNSSIIVIIPSHIKTTTDDIWNISIKPQLFTFIGFLLSWGFGLLIIISIIGYVLYRIYRKMMKGY